MDLTSIDVFHPPTANDPDISKYKEWAYFNIIDTSQNVIIFTTMGLTGNIYATDKYISNNLLGYITPTKSDLIGNPFYSFESSYSNNSPDFKAGKNTIVYSAYNNKYTVHEESEDGSIVLDAVFEPLTDPTPIYYSKINQDIVYWQAIAPKMKVTGTFKIESTTYNLVNATGYHDRNWGNWIWDTVGWNWGEVGGQTYTLVFADFTDVNHLALTNKTIEIWKNNVLVKTVNNVTLTQDVTSTLLEYPGISFPRNVQLSSPELYISFTANKVKPIPTPLEQSIGSRIIWELIGTYTVNGIVDGEQISFTEDGYYEYFGVGSINQIGLKPSYFNPMVVVSAAILVIAYLILKKE